MVQVKTVNMRQKRSLRVLITSSDDASRLGIGHVRIDISSRMSHDYERLLPGTQHGFRRDFVITCKVTSSVHTPRPAHTPSITPLLARCCFNLSFCLRAA